MNNNLSYDTLKSWLNFCNRLFALNSVKTNEGKISPLPTTDPAGDQPWKCCSDYPSQKSNMRLTNYTSY